MSVLIQYNRKSRIIQLISGRCLKLLAGVVAQLQTGERQLTIGVRVAFCDLASRGVVQTETGALKRCVRIRVHLADLNTGFPQCIGSGRRDIQGCGCNSDWVLRVVHHIPGGGADLLIAITSQREVREDCRAICSGSHIGYLVAICIIEPVGHACQRLAGVGVGLIDGQAALFVHNGSLDFDVGSHGIKARAGIAGQGLILAGRIVPTQHCFVGINTIGAAGGGVGFLGGEVLCSLRRGRDGQGVAALCERNAVTAIAGKIEVVQHAVAVRHAGAVVAAGVLRQLNGVAPAAACRRKAGNIRSALHGVHNFAVPHGKRGITGRIDTAVKRTGFPRAVVVGASVLTNQVPDNRLRSGPLFCVNNIAAVAVAVCRAILRTGITTGQGQCDAALHRGRQVVPAPAGALHIIAAVVRPNTGLDAIGQRTVDILDVIQGATTSQAAVRQNGQIPCAGCGRAAVIVLFESQLTGVDIDLVLDHNGSGVGGHGQHRRHDQCKYQGCKSFNSFQ